MCQLPRLRILQVQLICSYFKNGAGAHTTKKGRGCLIRLDKISYYMENNRIEAKKAAGGLPHSLWETYSAFCNTFGGLILLGIEESPEHALSVNGIPSPNAMLEEFWNILRDTTQVSANILSPDDVTVRQIGDKSIIVIEVPRASRRQKPVYVGDDPYHGSYRRCGEGDYHCTTEEVRGMLRNRDTGMDERPLAQFSVACLEEETIARYRYRFEKQNPAHKWVALSDEDFMQQIMATTTYDKKRVPTAAGLLMFGREQDITEAFPGYYLDYRERPLAGAPDTMRILSGTGDWSGNLCDFYFCVYDKLASWVTSLFHQEHHPNAPIRHAVAEALANAVIHSDHDVGSGLMVEKTRDRLSITNPGMLRITPDEAMRGGILDQRNPTLSKIFSYVGVGSGTGMGLRRIRTIWEESNLGKSQLSEQFNPDAVTFSLTIELDMISTDEIRESILSFLTEHIQASGDMLSKGLSVPRSKLDAVLQELVVSGNVCPVMPDVYQLKR